MGLKHEERLRATVQTVQLWDEHYFSAAAPISGLAVRSSVGRTNQHDLLLFVATLGVLIPTLNPARLLQSELTEAERNDNASEFWMQELELQSVDLECFGTLNYMQKHMWVCVNVWACTCVYTIRPLTGIIYSDILHKLALLCEHFLNTAVIKLK